MASRLRILVENPLVWGGGSETLMQSIVEYFKNDYDFTVLTDPARSEDFPAAADPHVRWIRRHSGWIPCRRYTPRWFFNRVTLKADDLLFGAALSAANCDVAIAMAEGPGMKHIGTMRAKRKIGWVQKDFRFLHTSKNHFSSAEQELRCMRRFEKIVCVSEAARRGVIETIGDPGNLCVRYNPIDHEKIRRLSGEPCELAAEVGRPLVVSVGGLREVKNYPVLLAACAALRQKAEFDLCIVGDGPERENLARLIADKGYSFARLVGALHNPYPLMRRAALYVSASTSETYGLSIQESLILGVPAVAVRNPGVAEAFDERFGILTDNSVPALRDALGRMLCEDGLLQRFRAAIAKDYSTDGLYEKRFEAIRGLWTP